MLHFYMPISEGSNKEYPDVIFDIFGDPYKRKILFALFNNPRQNILDVPKILERIGNDISLLYPAVEEMVDDGLVIRNMKESQNGLMITYKLDDSLYKKCIEFNNRNDKMIEKMSKYYLG